MLSLIPDLSVIAHSIFIENCFAESYLIWSIQESKIIEHMSSCVDVYVKCAVLVYNVCMHAIKSSTNVELRCQCVVQ